MDSIAKLHGSSKWAFVQENKFPGQGSDFDKVFIFKMNLTDLTNDGRTFGG